jgi:hypothetical protein
MLVKELDVISDLPNKFIVETIYNAWISYVVQNCQLEITVIQILEDLNARMDWFVMEIFAVVKELCMMDNGANLKVFAVVMFVVPEQYVMKDVQFLVSQTLTVHLLVKFVTNQLVPSVEPAHNLFVVQKSNIQFAREIHFPPLHLQNQTMLDVRRQLLNSFVQVNARNVQI